MNVRDVLAECDLFATLEADALTTLSTLTQVVSVAGSERLFAEGDPSDALYIVATGRLRATSAGRVLGFIGRLEPLGELGLISGETRSADVHAVRDSLLLKIGGSELLSFLLAHPPALVAMARVLIKRLRENQRDLARQSARSARSFAVVPASPDVHLNNLADSLVRELGRHDTVRLLNEAAVDAALGRGHAQAASGSREAHRLMEWLNQQEQEHRHLIYVGNQEADPWTLRCLRQADRVLVVAHADALPLAMPVIAEMKTSTMLATIELVLVTRTGEPGNVMAWKQQTNARAHYFVSPGDETSAARLARQISGHGIGVVLGGGGARGFAHIGLLRALDELHIPVDLICGSSMGAFFAALRAALYTPHEMRHIALDTFVHHNLLNDYLFPPRVSLIRGRKFTRRLHEVFGERRIEELKLPYFCVSSNLTRGTAMLHDEGRLADWLAASMSVPGFAPPIAWKGELLVDGAVANSLPTELMQSLERGPIIASDVSTEGSVSAPGVEGPDPEALLNWNSDERRPGLREILFRTATLTSESGVARRAAAADVYIRMPVGEIGMFDWKRIDEIIERGHRHALEQLQPVRDKLMS